MKPDRTAQWIEDMRELRGARLALYDNALMQGRLTPQQILAQPEDAEWLVRHYLLSDYGDAWGPRKMDNARVLWEQNGPASANLPGRGAAMPNSEPGLRAAENGAARPAVHTHQGEFFAEVYQP